MNIFARLVRVLLGETAIAAHKLEHGSKLVILGMMVSVCDVSICMFVTCLLRAQVIPSKDGVKYTLCEKKRMKWLAILDRAISAGHLDSGESQKLAGRLSWATQLLFHRYGVFFKMVVSLCAGICFVGSDGPCLGQSSLNGSRVTVMWVHG